MLNEYSDCWIRDKVDLDAESWLIDVLKGEGKGECKINIC